MHDDEGNTTKEGKELFDTEDECQAFIDQMGGKTAATVEVLSNPLFHVIKLGNKFGWYEQDEQGNTVREGANTDGELFARHSEAQTFLNEHFPATGAGEKTDDKLNAPTGDSAVGPGNGHIAGNTSNARMSTSEEAEMPKPNDDEGDKPEGSPFSNLQRFEVGQKVDFFITNPEDKYAGEHTVIEERAEEVGHSYKTDKSGETFIHAHWFAPAGTPRE